MSAKEMLDGAICGPSQAGIGTKLNMRTRLDMGFGCVYLRNNRGRWSAAWMPREGERVQTAYAAEWIAAQAAGFWELTFDSPMSSETYLRVGPNDWRLERKGLGFA